MRYESKMRKDLDMPSQKEVEQALLKALFRHNGVIKEFSVEEEIVHELADEFGLNEAQRTAFLEGIYRKENRTKRSHLWSRVLYRAADSLSKGKLVSKPSLTVRLTNKKEWMLTENGFDKALEILNIPTTTKEFLLVKSVEVQKVVNKLIDSPRPEDYDPFDKSKKIAKITKESAIRRRGFRQAVIEAYDYRCAFCGMKISSPDSLIWEVEAAHIVPHSSMGKDDIWNGLALCHLHHWAFDVGWFTMKDDFKIQVSSKASSLPSDIGKIGNYDFIRAYSDGRNKILLPKRKEVYPHANAIAWHRNNKFHP